MLEHPCRGQGEVHVFCVQLLIRRRKGQPDIAIGPVHVIPEALSVCLPVKGSDWVATKICSQTTYVSLWDEWTEHGYGLWRTRHFRLFINCYGSTDLANGREGVV